MAESIILGFILGVIATLSAGKLISVYTEEYVALYKYLWEHIKE